MSFPTFEELQKMPLNRVRLLDIKTPEQERLVQEIVNKKMVKLPPQNQIYDRLDHDIKSKEEELRVQKELDERREKLKPVITVNVEDNGIDIQIKEKEEELKTLNAELKTALVTCETCSKEFKTDKLLKMHKGRFHKVNG